MGEWEHLQRNVGEWRGWFDSLDRTLQRTKRQPSLLTLETGSLRCATESDPAALA